MDDLGRTTHVQQASAIGKLFEAALEGVTVRGTPDRRVRLTHLGVQTTHGGALSRQHIVLEPSDPGVPSVVVGWVDVGSGLARIKTYGAVTEILAARFGEEAPVIDEGSYLGFVTLAKRALAPRGIAVSLDSLPSLPPPPRDVEPAPEPSRTSWALAALALVGVGALAIAIAL